MENCMPIGDVTSNSPGSGARFNDGKPDLSLIPPSLLPSGSMLHSQLLYALDEMMFAGNGVHLKNWYDIVVRDKASTTAAVFEYGKGKYTAWNWTKGMPWSVPIACALRHAQALWIDREELDKESKLPHLGHILCNVVMILYYRKHYPQGNDLPHAIIQGEDK